MVETQHLLSLSRVLLGGLVLSELLRSETSYLVLPAVLCAAAADWADGRLARGSGRASMAGRLIDNLCDAVFLAACFTAFGYRAIWSDPVAGSATSYWAYANWLPLLAFLPAFGLYLLRWWLCNRAGAPLEPSTRGHSAGIFNYVLAVLGGIAVVPGLQVTRWLLEPAFVTVALLNATAVSENLLLIAQIRSKRS